MDTSLVILMLFVFSLAVRDIVQDIWLGERFQSRSDSALAVCLSLSLGSLGTIAARGGMTELAQVFESSALLWRAIVLGILAAVIYGVTYELVVRIGSGLFDLLDWGLSPPLTAVLAILVLGESNSIPLTATAFLVSGLGILSLYLSGAFGRKSGAESSALLIAIALMCPICVAATYLIKKQLFSEPLGPLSIDVVLALRFTPAAIFLAMYGWIKNKSIMRVESPTPTVILTAVLGTIPAVLVCFALVRTAMTEVGAWNFAIPALCFFGTLGFRKHSANRSPQRILSAIIVMLGLFIFEAFGG